MRRAYQKSSTRAFTESLHRPMGICCSTRTVDDPPPAATREVKSQEQSPPVVARSVEASVSSQRAPSQVPMSDKPIRHRANSTPQKVPSMKDGEDLPPVPNPRTRAKSSAAPRSRKPSSPTSAGEYDHGQSTYFTDNHKRAQGHHPLDDRP
jgi:hypothetical protein